MRLRRSVLAGLVAGAAAGFLVALLRPRSLHPTVSTAAGQFPEDHLAPLTETAPSIETGPTIETAPTIETGPRTETAPQTEPAPPTSLATEPAPGDPTDAAPVDAAAPARPAPLDSVRAQD
jgi:hypothetical protein